MHRPMAWAMCFSTVLTEIPFRWAICWKVSPLIRFSKKTSRNFGGKPSIICRKKTAGSAGGRVCSSSRRSSLAAIGSSRWARRKRLAARFSAMRRKNALGAYSH